MKFVLISPEELRLPDYMLETLKNAGARYEEIPALEAALPVLDVLYMTRVQKERFDDESEYGRVKDCYVLTAEKMKLAKKSAVVLHPLPRVNEIAEDVDDDPRAAYFRQTMNGKLMRMALILKVVSEKGGEVGREETVAGGRCINKNAYRTPSLSRPSIKNGKKTANINAYTAKRCKRSTAFGKITVNFVLSAVSFPQTFAKSRAFSV